MLKKIIAIFIVLISVYVLSLTLIYSFDFDRINIHSKEGVVLLNSETLWPKLFFNKSVGGMLDNFTDKVMLEEAVPNDKSLNALEQSMHMNGYARYWHGYQVFLRPLLIGFKYVEIRYFASFVIFGMLFWVLNIFRDRVNIAFANFFLFSLCCCKLFLIPMCMQFFNMTLLMLVSVVFADKFCLNDDLIRKKNFERFYICSFIVGSLTAFFDLLTTPLLPIGVLMLFWLCFFEKDKSIEIKNKFIFFNLFNWLLGYIGTWASKWIIATLVTSENIIINAINQVIYRTGSKFALSEGGKSVSKFEALKLNFKMLFLPLGNTKIIILIFLILLVFSVLIYYFRRKEMNNNFVKRILFISSLPQIWYFITANHSQLHHSFTYRSQIITLLGVIYLAYYMIDWNKVKSRLAWRKINV